MPRERCVRIGACLLALAAMLATPAAAQDAAEFYKGKTVSILMGTGPGASYDLYGRTIAERMFPATSPASRR